MGANKLAQEEMFSIVQVISVRSMNTTYCSKENLTQDFKMH